jgi:hypothetical protein
MTTPRNGQIGLDTWTLSKAGVPQKQVIHKCLLITTGTNVYISKKRSNRVRAKPLSNLDMSKCPRATRKTDTA